jgi:hypothetical protein
MAGVLALGSCGGLAADGPSRIATDAEGGQAAEVGSGLDAGRPIVSESAGAAGYPGFVEPDSSGAGARSGGMVAGVPNVGEACGLDSDGGERVTIGGIVLEASGNCGAGHLCLMWASAVDSACPEAPEGTGCAVLDRDDELVPVPPQLAPAPPAVDRVCTCRCDGPHGDGGYCACPAGMSCRELIASSGVNGAAADFLGSYCLY